MKMKLMLLAGLMILAMTAMGYADSEGAGNAVVNGVTQIVKAPLTLLQKAGDSMENAPATQRGSEDVVVSDPYNLDAETTG